MISLKELATEEGRRTYYTYNLKDPATLYHHSEPFLAPMYNEQLLELWGTDVHGDQLLRISWSGTLAAPAFKDVGDSVIEYEGKKYPFMRLVVNEGFEFHNKDGNLVFVTDVKDVPENTVFAVRKRYEDLGKMMFVLEMKFTAEQLVQQGYYPAFDSPEFDEWCVKNGKRYAPRPNPKGEYRFCNFIQTPDGKYRDVSPADVDNIRQLINRANSETEMEYITRKQEEREKVFAIAKHEKEAHFASVVGDSIVRAEKKLAKGKIIYGV